MKSREEVAGLRKVNAELRRSNKELRDREGRGARERERDKGVARRRKVD